MAGARARKNAGGLILALDAGASHVRVAIADASGRVLGRGEAGPANPYALGAETADRERRRGIVACLRGAGARRAAIRAVVIGSAGVSQPTVAADVARRTHRLLPRAQVRIVTDGEIAHVGALAGAQGIVVIAGTGSIVWGRNARGQWARAGGWGWLLGDEGSGQWLGRKGYAAALCALDGSGPPTALTGLLQAAFRLRTPQALARRARPATPADFGGLAPLVFEAAAQRDRIARALITAGAEALAAQIAAAARRLGMRQPRVSYGGSVLAASPLIRQALRRALRRQLPGARWQPPAGDALDGALRLARPLA
ncbi:MAG: N-acetylglucosamine kinase [Terriglobales bacterium]